MPRQSLLHVAAVAVLLIAPITTRAQVALPGFEWGLGKRESVRRMERIGYPHTGGDLRRSSVLLFGGPEKADITLTFADPDADDAMAFKQRPGHLGLQMFNGMWKPAAEAHVLAIAGPFLDGMIAKYGPPQVLGRRGLQVASSEIRTWRTWPATDILRAEWRTKDSQVSIAMLRAPTKGNGIDLPRVVMIQSTGPGDPTRDWVNESDYDARKNRTRP